MFRAEISWLANRPILKMDGKLVGDWAEEAKSLVTAEVTSRALIVDLTGVSYVDWVGERFLNWLASLGAQFLAGNVYTVAICERLSLPKPRRLDKNYGAGVGERVTTA